MLRRFLFDALPDSAAKPLVMFAGTVLAATVAIAPVCPRADTLTGRDISITASSSTARMES
jgi:hypothetical protein